MKAAVLESSTRGTCAQQVSTIISGQPGACGWGSASVTGAWTGSAATWRRCRQTIASASASATPRDSVSAMKSEPGWPGAARDPTGSPRDIPCGGIGPSTRGGVRRRSCWNCGNWRPEPRAIPFRWEQTRGCSGPGIWSTTRRWTCSPPRPITMPPPGSRATCRWWQKPPPLVRPLRLAGLGESRLPALRGR